MSTVISLEDVTNATRTGSFDLLIAALSLHLQAERQAGRITGQEYTNAYVQMMTAAIQQSFSFELQKAQAQNQANLIAAQIAQTNAETQRIISANTLLGVERDNAILQGLQITAQTGLIASQKLIADQERLRLIEDTKEVVERTRLVNSQRLIADIERDKVSKEVLQIIAQTNLATKQLEIVTEEKLKLIEETKLTAKQIQVADQQILGQVKQNLRTDEEIKFTKAKTETELANVVDAVNGQTVSGVVGRQKDLLRAQTEGFRRNAEQGMVKVFAEIWSVLRSTDPDAVTPNEFGFSPTSCREVINKGREGIGLPPT